MGVAVDMAKRAAGVGLGSARAAETGLTAGMGLSIFGYHASGAGSIAARVMARDFYGGARWVGRRVRQNPIKSLIGGAGIFGVGAVGYGAYKIEQSVARGAEAEQMARMILTAQSGPYGPAGRMMGISSNHNNTAGLTLAAHYARNRSKNFGVLGLKFL
jgi:hypothetical protein